MRWLAGITNYMDMSLSQLWATVKDREVLQSLGSESDMTERLNSRSPHTTGWDRLHVNTRPPALAPRS